VKKPLFFKKGGAAENPPKKNSPPPGREGRPPRVVKPPLFPPWGKNSLCPLKIEMWGRNPFKNSPLLHRPFPWGCPPLK